MLKDRMDDASRFARFLSREAADYHDPPEPPVEAMWAGIEARLGESPVSGSPKSADMAGAEDCVGDAADSPFDVLGYHDPPPAPVEVMWERIEAEWVVRQPDSTTRRSTGGSLRLVAVRTLRRRPARAAIWLTGAAAASITLAVALDRDTQLPVSTEPETVASAAPASVERAARAEPLVAATDSGPLAPTAAEEALALAVVEEPLETVRQFAAAGPPPAAGPAPASARRPVGSAPRATADEYDVADHLDRAAMLLVAFRTDSGGAESQRDLANWAREVLVETRSLLAALNGDGERERASLRDLELILVQIARLGPDAPDFERELAREGLDRQGTLLRLRSAIGA